MKFTDVIKYYMEHPYQDFDYKTYVDKYKVKELVRAIIIPFITYSYFTKINEVVDFKWEFNYPVIVKATHGCGWFKVLKSKDDVDVKLISDISYWLNNKYREDIEKQYSFLVPGVIVEKYMGELDDYKFYMFNGSLEFIQLDRGRNSIRTQDFYDKNWNLLKLRKRLSKFGGFVKAPSCLGTMLTKVKQLVNLIGNPPFVRVDLYIIDGEIYFGEFTFTPASGTNELQPLENEIKYGQLIKPS